MSKPFVVPEQTTPSTDLITTLASILTDLCEANDKRDSKVISKFHAASIPTISIAQYLNRIRQYADCSDTCFMLSLIYVDRIQAHPDFIVNSFNVHRLLITSVMLAAKFFDDHYYNNAFYARIGGVSREEMNHLELEFLFMIGFTLAVTTEEYRQYDTELAAHAAALHKKTVPSPSARRVSISTSIAKSAPDSFPMEDPVPYSVNGWDGRPQDPVFATSAPTPNSFPVPPCIPTPNNKEHLIWQYPIDPPLPSYILKTSLGKQRTPIGPVAPSRPHTSHPQAVFCVDAMDTDCVSPVAPFEAVCAPPQFHPDQNVFNWVMIK